ncbi:MAG TPA: hypothetical protein PK668_21120 [Myxococcota bacterium]|nr:hypothetical protein [Myxococcota bacterium]HRY95977.1 hypothetical protein [Myxococcota bacterium]HSA22617.1 hypothetical protein [Myxococcota bacterium]
MPAGDLRSFLLDRPGLLGWPWLAGGVPGALSAAEAARRPFRVLVARLSGFPDVQESFGHRLLYALLAARADTAPDLAFLPSAELAARLGEAGLPWLFGWLSQRPVQDFQLLALSNALVQELVNLPGLLARSGLPLSKATRLARPELPLVLLGGSNALHSTVFWGPDPPVDGVFVGEDPAALGELFARAARGSLEGRTKPEILRALEGVDGFLQPDAPRRTRKRLARPEALNGWIARMPWLPGTEQAGSAPLVVSDGCPAGCAFCAEAWSRRPYREAAAAGLLAQAQAAKAALGLSAIEVYSFNFNLHAELGALLRGLARSFAGVALKSQRLDGLAADPALLGAQHALGKASLTVGLEGISPRLRRYLGKGLDEGAVRRAFAALAGAPLRSLKIFLIATGLEEAEDLAAFDGLLEHLRRALGLADRRPRVVFSATPLVCFPWTPFEFEDARPARRYAQALADIRARVLAAGFEHRAAAEAGEAWVAQVLARAADPRVALALHDALGRTGFVYRSRIPASFARAFQQALTAQGLDEAELRRGSAPGGSPPWAALDLGLSRARLRTRLEAHQGCLEPPGFRVRPGARAWPELAALGALRAAQRGRVRVLGVRVRLDARQRHLPRRSAGAQLGGALMRAEPGLVEGAWGFAGSRVEELLGSSAPSGLDELQLAFLEPADGLAARRLAEAACLARLNLELEGWLEVLGPAEGLSLEALELRLRSPFEFCGQEWARALGLKPTRRRDAAGGFRWELGPAARKKRLVSALAWRELEGGGCEVALAPGQKLALDDFLRTAFRLPSPDAWLRIAVTSESRSPGR